MGFSVVKNGDIRAIRGDGRGLGGREGVREGERHANPPPLCMLTTQILISNGRAANTPCINVSARDIWLKDTFNICTGLLPQCALQLNVNFSPCKTIFFCSFLMKLALFQYPESQICEAVSSFLILLMSLFDGSRPKIKKKSCGGSCV